MNDFITNFEDRVKEVESYFRFLDKLDEENVKLYFSEINRYSQIDDDIIIILKANAFLVIYNLIESSIREGILTIYDIIIQENRSYEALTTKIRSIWTNFEFRKIFDISSNWKSYYNKTSELIQHVIDKEVIKLNRKAIPISGNLDADQVRTLCDLHGIKKNVHYRARGGATLETIKSARNSLAHGNLSFIECGRQYDFDQLRKMKKESIVFVRSILRNVEEFITNKKYATNSSIT
ncbi:MAG: MAE_28990/MAE_18760 family HEPN-like nuclease [Candidatus Hodarchaeota archaeon]